jgi:hypothetical protein
VGRWSFAARTKFTTAARGRDGWSTSTSRPPTRTRGTNCRLAAREGDPTWSFSCRAAFPGSAKYNARVLAAVKRRAGWAGASRRLPAAVQFAQSVSLEEPVDLARGGE